MAEPTKIYVKPGKGVKVPLRIPGTPTRVPKEGCQVTRDFAVERLLRSGDLIEAEAPPPAPEPAAEPAAAKKG